jgi:DivIVA domain-containing protein
MDISPQTIRSTGFKTVKKGYDPDEVEAFRAQVAIAVESAQNQATSMEARARAAVAKLQELSQQVNTPGREAAPAPTHSGDTEVISRTLLLAQRTADAALAEARAEAENINGRAREEAARVLDSARTMAAKTIEDARTDARRAVDDERVKAENEVQALLARRDFLLGDVDHLEQYLQAQRERLRDAAVQLQELVDRVPGGLGDMRRPLLSASAEPLPERPAAPAATAQPAVAVAPAAQEPAPVETPAPAQAAATLPTLSLDDAPITEQVPVIAPARPAPVVDLDPSPLFTPMPERQAERAAERPTDLTSMAMSNSADAKENVWRLLDEEVATTQAAQSAFTLDDVTAEVPAVAPQVQQHDPFRIGGDELR